MTKIISQKSVFQAKWFDVYEVHLELENGENRVHHDVIRKPSVSIFPLDESGNVYLIDQYRYMLNKRILESASGMLDEGENPLEAAKRELKEETGIVGNKWTSLGLHHSAGSISTWEKTLFLVQDLEFGDAKPEEIEDIKLVKLPLAEAVQKVLDQEIDTGSTSFGILLIDKLRQLGKI